MISGGKVSEAASVGVMCMCVCDVKAIEAALFVVLLRSRTKKRKTSPVSFCFCQYSE